MIADLIRPAFICFLVCTSFVYAQRRETAKISGYVRDKDGNALSEAIVHLRNTAYSANVDKEGYFVLVARPGAYELVASSIGYLSQTVSVTIKNGEDKHQSLSLESDPNMVIDQVIVTGKSAIAEVRESPFNVVALDAKSLYNSTLDLGHMLDKASGVKIRETGGVGSNMSVTLNGFTGRHIKIFMDGVPMEGFGSAFQLNNIPVNIADRIEVYKGVVPIEFGADALGGVVNIVTSQSSNTYLDASYSYGSFNTHKSSVNFGHTTRSGFVFQLNAFQNYSDNDYRVLTYVLDVNSGNFSMDREWVRRFNDQYHNETIIGKIGVVNKPWADRLMLGLTLGQVKAGIQSSNVMQVAFGKRERQGTTILPSLTYDKRNLFTENLNLSVTANYNRNYNQNIDTAARQYSWNGDYRATNSIGESVYSLAEYFNKNGSVTANLNYQFKERHRLNFNNVFTGYRRENADKAAFYTDASQAIDTIPRYSTKNVLGAEYRYSPNRMWTTAVFGKHYSQNVTGPVDISTQSSRTEYVQRDASYRTFGYGIASTYFWRQFQFKASFEKAYRLPTENELFGDEVLEVANATLRAENSRNYNLGATYNGELGEGHSLYIDGSLMYRDIKDYIRRVVDQRITGAGAGTAASTNHGQVSNKGIDMEIRYFYKDKLSIGANATYQDLRNKERYVSPTSAQLSNIYNDRVPNMPYLFGNGDVAYFLYDFYGKGNLLSIGYTLNYVHEFFLRWESNGAVETKDVVPQQLSHDISVTYMLGNGKYNIAFEARNITDENLYDNFSLQKPGRNLSLKLRYYFSKKHQ